MGNGPATRTRLCLCVVYGRTFRCPARSNSPFITSIIGDGAAEDYSTMMQGPWGVLNEPKPTWWIKPYSFACKGKPSAAILMKPLVLILNRSYSMQIDGRPVSQRC
ncbi:hypothetical protein V8C34DRAFT_211454 [Trichoderma compactum]